MQRSLRSAKRSARCGRSRMRSHRGEKTAEAIHTEITREVTTLLGRIFAERKQTDGMDLEAVEMGFRAVLHQAGAAALTQLLEFPELLVDFDPGFLADGVVGVQLARQVPELARSCMWPGTI
jgi:hypothetical protein